MVEVVPPSTPNITPSELQHSSGSDPITPCLCVCERKLLVCVCIRGVSHDYSIGDSELVQKSKHERIGRRSLKNTASYDNLK